MTPEQLLEILSVAEKLKCNTRHCYTSNGRHESVAEHTFRMALMGMLISGEPEFADADMNKVIRMCLIHDLGEAFTGDIPTFLKNSGDAKKEDELFDEWVASFPEKQREEFQSLLDEMKEMKTLEAKIYKALDKMEAVIQHNESDISTWLPLEYELQYTYGREQVEFSPYMKGLKAAVDAWTDRKIKEG
ncbi:MAG: HD domain-containing protein [Eubacteriales bacterium]|nr:HD domain-containing protein [Eubacteriales bacterium]